MSLLIRRTLATSLFGINRLFLAHGILRKLSIERIEQLSQRILQMTQGGTIRINAGNLKPDVACKISVESSWIDHCEISSLTHSMVESYYDPTENSVHVKILEAIENMNSLQLPFINIDMKVPEICNIYIEGCQVQASITNKIMGDLTITSSSGMIEIDKVKGENLKLEVGNSDVRITKLLEGSQGSIKCRDFFAKMINFKGINIQSTDARIEALYATTAAIVTERNVIIDLMRGWIMSKSIAADIFIRGIDGSFDLEACHGRIELQINKLETASRSVAKASQGNVLVKVDPKVSSRISCSTCSNSSSASRNSITITSSTFIESAVQNESTGVFRAVHGTLIGLDPNSPAMMQSGKINTTAAEAQSMGSDSDELPELSLISNAHIRVESLSWMDAIKLKHGFDISSEASPQRLGRTGRARLDALNLLK